MYYRRTLCDNGVLKARFDSGYLVEQQRENASIPDELKVSLSSGVRASHLIFGKPEYKEEYLSLLERYLLLPNVSKRTAYEAALSQMTGAPLSAVNAILEKRTNASLRFLGIGFAFDWKEIYTVASEVAKLYGHLADTGDVIECYKDAPKRRSTYQGYGDFRKANPPVCFSPEGILLENYLPKDYIEDYMTQK